MSTYQDGNKFYIRDRFVLSGENTENPCHEELFHFLYYETEASSFLGFLAPISSSNT